MKNVQFVSRRSVSRRTFLRGAGVAMALPLLEAMAPAVVRAASFGKEPRRMLAVCNNLGLLPENFFPEAGAAGRDYKLSPYLELLKDHRNDFTVFSGVWHPD